MCDINLISISTIAASQDPRLCYLVNNVSRLFSLERLLTLSVAAGHGWVISRVHHARLCFSGQSTGVEVRWFEFYFPGRSSIEYLYLHPWHWGQYQPHPWDSKMVYGEMKALGQGHQLSLGLGYKWRASSGDLSFCKCFARVLRVSESFIFLAL